MITVSSMNTGRLFLSFWDICLDNLPEGTFRRRRIPADDAKQRIIQAREGNRLLCLSDHDLVAPYRKREVERFDAFCRVLNEHFGLRLSLNDFCSEYDHEGETYYSINPLNCVEVQGDDRLMIVTCAYVPDGNPGARPAFRIGPSTIEFHLIESM